MKATYSIKIIENEALKDMPKHLKEIYYSENSIAENLKPTLYFNDTISEYFLEENVIDSKIAVAVFCECSKPIYTFNEKRINLKYNPNYNIIGINENQYVIEDSLKSNWITTNESKIIENFKVFKATQKNKYKTRTKEITKTIVAWYCPEIQYNFGPKGYGGLPGLIIELQDENTIIGLTSLKEANHFFDCRELILSKNKITSEKLNEKINESHNGLSNEIKNKEKQ